jgi:hypothetical protein
MHNREMDHNELQILFKNSLIYGIYEETQGNIIPD